MGIDWRLCSSAWNANGVGVNPLHSHRVQLEKSELKVNRCDVVRVRTYCSSADNLRRPNPWDADADFRAQR